MEQAEEALAWCTPKQIEIALKKENERGYHGPDVVKMLLLGKYGFQRGKKRFKEKPVKPSASQQLEQDLETGGESWPKMADRRSTLEDLNELDLESLQELDPQEE